MAKYIELEDAYRTLSNYYHHSTYVQSIALREALDRVPTADVVERKTGKWLEVELLHLSDDPEELEVTSVASMRCSVCKRYHNEAHLYGSDLTEDVNYCPYCGADMRPEPPKEE